MNITTKFWASVDFPSPRFGHVTSNIAESMNSWIKDIRFMNHFDIIIEIPRLMNKLFLKRRSFA